MLMIKYIPVDRHNNADTKKKERRWRRLYYKMSRSAGKLFVCLLKLVLLPISKMKMEFENYFSSNIKHFYEDLMSETCIYSS